MVSTLLSPSWQKKIIIIKNRQDHSVFNK
jgi:hypothetical protein